MQRDSADQRPFRDILFLAITRLDGREQERPAAIEGVAGNREVDRIEMNPDLMSAAGLRFTLEQGEAAELLDNFKPCGRSLAVLLIDTHQAKLQRVGTELF